MNLIKKYHKKNVLVFLIKNVIPKTEMLELKFSQISMMEINVLFP